MNRNEIFVYVEKKYGTKPEYLWKKHPTFAVLRHNNGKWYSVIMKVKKSQIGLDGEDEIEIINVKCDSQLAGVITQTYGFLPGYHMNKKYWITILLDGTIEGEKILDFLDGSYDLIDKQSRKRNRNVS